MFRGGFRLWRGALALTALLAAAPGPAIAEQVDSNWAGSRAKVETALEQGDLRGARRTAQGAFEVLARAANAAPTDLAQSRDLLVDMATMAGEAGRPGVVALAEEALSAWRSLTGSSSLPVAAAMHRLGDIHFQRGTFKEARALHGAALALRQHLSAPDDLIADSLERLARVETRLESYASAGRHLERALVVREQGSDRRALARTLELIGWLHRFAGNYAASQQALDRSRGILPREPAVTVQVVTAIELEGDLLMLGGNAPRAYSTWADGGRLAREALGTDHPLVAAFERRLALSAAAAGDRQQSLTHLAEGLRIAREQMAACDPERIGLEDYAASSAMYDGQFVDAQRKYVAVMESCTTCLGETHALTATVTSNLASLALLMGDMPEAEKLNRHALAIWSGINRQHPYVAEALDALAEVVTLTGRLQTARGLYARALRIRRGINVDHPDVAWTLTNLARVTAAAGESTQALAYVTDALTIYGRSGSVRDPDHLARARLLQGELLAQRGAPDRALESMRVALAAREQFFGASHPLTTDARARMARVEWAAGASTAALTDALDAEAKGREHVRATVKYLPERHALTYATTRPEGLNVALSIAAAGHASQLDAVVDSVFKSRSLVLDELSSRKPAAVDPRLAGVSQTLIEKRQRLANLMLRSISGHADEVPPQLLDLARKEKDDAEATLAKQSLEFRTELMKQSIGLDEVRHSLPVGSALVSFVRFRVARAASGVVAQSGGGSDDFAYLAFVVRADDGRPSLVSLGSETRVGAAVHRWRRALMLEAGTGPPGASRITARAYGVQLRQLLWDPIARHLTGTSRVFVVPDGDVNLIPFAGLPSGGSEYLLTAGPLMHYLSAERDIVTYANHSATTGRGLLAVGGATFELAQAETTPGAERRRAGMPYPCMPSGGPAFRPLPGTLREVQTVSELWKASVSESTDSPQVFSGADASEMMFKRLAPGRRVLHLATHGFALQADCDPVQATTRGVGRIVPTHRPKPRTAPSSADTALLLAGLAFAGANSRLQSRPEHDDGILTAEEVASLNLQGVEWAVLSACDTGRGEFLAGEGVLGLRRSFQVAGARSVVMSLWGVEDQSTAQWMAELYRARLAEGMDTAEAVHAASVRFLASRQAQNRSTSPFYWAGFVAAGDWR